MLASHQDPIVAIATAPGRGGVGIVRVSGRGLESLVLAVCGRRLNPRHAHYGDFRDADGSVIDQGLALHFPGPASYTGEDVLELQGHGGPVVLQLLLARCLQAAAETDPATGRPRLAGLRLAEPGEFTQRAFLNDKLDLAQAEAVADLIDASTEAAARSAGRSLTGAFSREVESLRSALVELRMLVEATLDFPEEEIDFLTRADAQGRLARTAQALDAVLAQARAGALLRDGLTVVLAGQPNVGKSSLLNALAGAELAIVTPIAGTTRDKVRETIQIEGVPLHVVDTAGLRDDEDAEVGEVERIGIGRSWEAIRAADAVLFLHDLTRMGDPVYRAAEQGIADGLHRHGIRDEALLHVFNKLDAAAGEGAARAAAAALGLGDVADDALVAISARTGTGLEPLRRTLLQRVGWQAAPEGVFIARQRHLQALRTAQGHLQQAQAWARQGDSSLDLFAEELRLAHDALGAITGVFTADDLLGEIFGRFCIGK
ncbi:MAG: tRNA uridine-5-carboxymethylaminomethyl(34) synthesis GTPase MnmE [Aquabacterium sp.]|nr:MAG: tRNA uridine-5-carboxymethylaminomethyl(34) synthesis GTPase MnmE [Aquabacterium sp.]